MSKYLSPKLVIAEAWDITREHKKTLFWYGFIPAFFGMMVGAGYVFYQFFAFRHFLLGDQDTVQYVQIFKNTWDIMFSSGFSWVFITLGIITLLGYFTFPIFAQGSLIFLIEKIKKGEEPERGFQAGFSPFMPLFEFGAVANGIGLKTFFTEGSFVLRNLGRGMFGLILPLFIIFAVFGLIALFFFAYTPQVIVLKKKKLMGGITESARLSFTYFTETLSLFFLILLIELRVLINIVIILALPVIIAALTGLLAAQILSVTGIIITVVVGFVLISLAAMLSGTLQIFSTAIWTVAYHTLTPNDEKITEIEKIMEAS